MTATVRSATPARVWVPAVALPSAATLMWFWLSRLVETESVRGTCFAVGLTFLVIAVTIGPIVCWAWRTRQLEVLMEDDLADVRYRLRRLETESAPLSPAVGNLHAPTAGPYLRLVRPEEA